MNPVIWGNSHQSGDAHRPRDLRRLRKCKQGIFPTSSTSLEAEFASFVLAFLHSVRQTPSSPLAFSCFRSMSPVLLGFSFGWTPEVSWEAYVASLFQAVGMSGMPGRNERD
jgi:hypothetical protein